MPKNKLTLYIFIALILGVLVGYFYNVTIINPINNQISKAETSLKTINKALTAEKDTTTTIYKSLIAKKQVAITIRKTNNVLRDDKLVGFSILSDIFLRLIKMIVAPLVFTTLVVGVAKVGDINAVGRIGGKTLLWFLSATLVSLLLGMILVNFFEPGSSMHLSLPDNNTATDIKKSALSLKDFVSHVVPKSFFEAIANNEILQIVVFSLFFGIGTAAIGEKGLIVIKALDAIAHVILKVTGYIMKIAPLAVFGAITAIIAKEGLGVLSVYAVFISEFYFSLIR